MAKTPRIKHLPERDPVGTLIATFRKRAKLTQADLAVLIGASVSAVGQWEKDLKRPQPWALDLIAKACALNEYEGFLLFYEAGYALYDTPTAIIALLKAYALLPVEWQDAADALIASNTELLESWRAHSRKLGIEPKRRTVPSLEEMDGYWEARRHNRYHSRRLERGIRPQAGDPGDRR